MSEKNNQILIADDSRVIRRAAIKILQKEFQVLEAEDGQDAWEQLQTNPNIAVLFSDLGMPNMDGFELLKAIRGSEDQGISNMPVVIITGAEETDGTKEKVLELGATDFISKPFDSHSLKSRAATHIKYQKQVEKLEKQLAYDKLTGLLNEVSFKQQGEQVLSFARRHTTEMAVVRFDIARFSDVFVKYGKPVAEQILSKVASFINEGKRTEDMAARLGVSRFAMLLSDADKEGAETVVKRICERVARLKLKMGDEIFKIEFHTGMTTFQHGDAEIKFEGLLDQADKAQKLAIEKADGQIVCFHEAAGVAAPQKQAGEYVDVDLEALLKQLSAKDSGVTDQQLTSAMRKIIPLIAESDQRLRLGLSKVVHHLNKRL